MDLSEPEAWVRAVFAEFDDDDQRIYLLGSIDPDSGCSERGLFAYRAYFDEDVTLIGVPSTETSPGCRPVGCASLVTVTSPRKPEAEARAAVAAMEPIMAIEGRQMSDRDKDLLVDLIRGVVTIEDVAAVIAREEGYEID